jgi:hypothetical protein
MAPRKPMSDGTFRTSAADVDLNPDVTNQKRSADVMTKNSNTSTRKDAQRVEGQTVVNNMLSRPRTKADRKKSPY